MKLIQCFDYICQAKTQYNAVVIETESYNLQSIESQYMKYV